MGILASLAVPRMDRDLRQEAMDSIMSDIMLTQRMALSDHRHNNADDQWQRTYWQWSPFECTTRPEYGMYYVVYSDTNKLGSPNRSEAAIDSYNQKYLYAAQGGTTGYCTIGEVNEDDSSRVLITKKFGIVSIDRAGGCTAAKHIAFDELGRPHNNIDGSTSPNFASLMQTDCNLTFNFDNGLIDNTDSFTLTIEALTGRVYAAN